MKRGLLLRLAGVAVATFAGAAAGYGLLNLSAAWRGDRHFGALAGAVIGATLVYVITGIRLILKDRAYRRRLEELTGQLNRALESAEERYTSAQKLGESNQITKTRLATLHLVRNETIRSVEEFRQAEESGAHHPEFYNNYGVALARSGNRQQAVSALKQAAVQLSDSPVPHVNLAHAVAPAEICKDGEMARAALTHVARALEITGDSFEVLEREGIVLLQDGRYEEAKLEFNRAFERAEGTKRREADVKNHLGIDRLLAGDYRDAADEFKAAMSLDGGHARALCNSGILALLQNRQFAGIEALMQARELEPRSGVIQNNIGYALCQANATNEGLASFRKATQLDPSLWESYYNLSKVYADEGLYEVADKNATRALELRPNTWEAMVTLGVTKIRQNEHFTAAEILRKAVEMAPNEPTVLTNLGIALAFVFEYEEAERLLRTALVDGGQDPLPWARLAWMHVMQGISRLAVEELKTALKFAPKDPVYNNYFGLCNIDMGSPDVAMIYFKRALSLKPDYGAVHYHLGFVHLIRKQLEEAIKEWEKTIIAEPEFADGFVNLGVAYYEVGRLDEAVSAFRKALALRQNRMDDYSNLALAFSKQGQKLREGSKGTSDKKGKAAIEKFRQAVEMFDKALSMEPQNVVLHSNRGLACWYAERVDEACEEWTTVAHLDPEYAARRGELMRSAFDETSLSYSGLRISDRMFGFPLATPPLRYRLAPGYDVDRWDLLIEDDELAHVPALADEVQYLERNIRGLHV